MLPTKVFAKQTRVGANRLPDGSWEFLLWAPQARAVSLHFLRGSGELLAMEPLAEGYHRATIKNLEPCSEYFYRLDAERDLPDPASRFQPQGVQGSSQIVDPNVFRWTDHDWKGTTLERSIFYELHVGTYTPEGSFDAVIRHLPELAALGVTTIELMPVAQFPGPRNWGYDGVYLFAPQNTYGGPESLQRLVDAVHRHGLSIVLDVVYNHLGPEGNYLNAYGPYLTDRYQTPWGQAINFDVVGSDEVRRFFIENALYWLEDYHFDGLRLDAVHGIFDFGARHILAELKSAVADLSQRLGRPLHLIAESDLNDSRILRDPEHGGYGIDAQWSDDFHHSVHTLLTGENLGYYSDFEGVRPLVSTLRDGWYYSGQHSNYRKRRHGNSTCGISPTRFVVCNQNHDQVGNRAAGERLGHLVSEGRAHMAAAITLLSPMVPMLFQGEEWAASTPFQYFTELGDAHLRKAVTNGRRREFRAFGWPPDSIPDPQALATFERSILKWDEVQEGMHAHMLEWYRQLIELRRGRLLAFGEEAVATNAWYDSTRSLLAYTHADLLVCCNLGDDTVRVPEAMGATLLLSSETGVRMDVTPTLNADSVAVWGDAGKPTSS